MNFLSKMSRMPLFNRGSRAALVWCCMVVSLCLGCDHDDAAFERNFRMGYTLEAMSAKDYAWATAHPEIINLRVAYPAESATTEGTDSLTAPPGAIRCISVRTFWCDEETVQSLPDFSDPGFRAAYVLYCAQLIDRWAPLYFNMTDEANVLFSRQPQHWTEFVSFHAHVYEQLKRQYPGVTIFSSMAAAPLAHQVIDDNDHVLQRLAALQLIEQSDLYALSFTPATMARIESFNLKDPFDDLLYLSDKPTGVFISGNGDAAMPAGGLQNVFASFRKCNARFIVTEAPHSGADRVDPAWAKYFVLGYHPGGTVY